MWTRTLFAMKFRLQAFGVHLLCSALALTLILSALYLGWYHWPGWYLADVVHVIVVMVGVDVVIGPSITLVIANARKPRRELARDIAIIAVVQLAALGYGTAALWSGRPMYYAFSVNCLQVVQAFDIDPGSARTAREQKLVLAPHWYDLPRWIWAPFPSDKAKADKIFQSLMQGGFDIIGLPQYYKPWKDGAADVRAHLQKVSDVKFFTRKQRVLLAERMQADGLVPDDPNALALTGRAGSLLAVMEPRTLTLLAIIKPN